MFNDILEDMIDCDLKLYMGDRGLLDLKSPMTKMMLQIMAAFDEYAPNQQSTETIKSLRDNAKEGKVSGILPYGYRAVNMEPEIIKEEQEVIHMIYDMYIIGDKGVQAIANELNEMGVPTKYERMVEEAGTTKLISNRKHRNGVIWQSSTIYGMLTNSWYDGKRTYQGVEYNNVPRMVSKSKYQKVQEIIKLRKHKRFESAPKYQYLLRGLLKCDKCGRNWSGRFRENKNDNFYYCSSKDNKETNCGCPSINIYKLESFIIKHLFKTKDLKNMIENISKDNKVVTKLELEINNTKSKLKEAKDSRIKYAKLLGGKFGDDEEIIKQYEIIKTQALNIQKKLNKLELDYVELTQSEALNNYNQQLELVDGKSDFKTLKMAVDSIIEKITIKVLKKYNSENVKTFIIKVYYNGLSESSTFWVEKPYEEWFHYIDTKDATPAESKKMLEEDIKQYEEDAKEFDLIGDKSEFLFDNAKVDDYVLKNIQLNKEDIVKFNVKSKHKTKVNM